MALTTSIRGVATPVARRVTRPGARQAARDIRVDLVALARALKARKRQLKGAATVLASRSAPIGNG
jgi:hypothetical protein